MNELLGDPPQRFFWPAHFSQPYCAVCSASWKFNHSSSLLALLLWGRSEPAHHLWFICLPQQGVVCTGRGHCGQPRTWTSLVPSHIRLSREAVFFQVMPQNAKARVPKDLGVGCSWGIISATDGHVTLLESSLTRRLFTSSYCWVTYAPAVPSACLWLLSTFSMKSRVSGLHLLATNMAQQVSLTRENWPQLQYLGKQKA